ncbi:DUF3105 domain-containing protein [Streptomyces acidiscabies]|uniref:DUF3105 domain-containing protein n=1 Tax=Streptomyces acidiscabies TaxID=42234 RepID=UPI00073EEE8A|nr:DUF3105 domain-containing protein [Streptomyces acidiscabies]GAQ58114.1 hypothetical protein a10_07999 [Streptomyces acidiscabies]GAV40224.1 hypothetical protein Saa2_03112 [Streptomyces acidiscabies]
MSTGNSKKTPTSSKPKASAPATPKKRPGNKPSAGEKAATRRARIEEQRKAERARERRSRILTISASAAIVLALVAGGVWLVNDANEKEAAQAAPVSGEKTWKDLTQNHVEGTVKYPMIPPVGGDHNGIWQNCDAQVYTQQLQNENAVHSLEHGAVWVTYNTKAAEADVKSLTEKVKKTSYTMMSPYDAQSSPITLSAWEHQLNVTEASDPRVNEFFDKYVQGAQTPEPGAACSGGKATA